jgi:hypothetical protein
VGDIGWRIFFKWMMNGLADTRNLSADINNQLVDIRNQLARRKVVDSGNDYKSKSTSDGFQSVPAR